MQSTAPDQSKEHVKGFTGTLSDIAASKVIIHRLAIYLVLVVILSIPGYFLLSNQGITEPRISAAILMWAPGVSGLLTLAVSNGDFRTVGWRLGKARYLAAALAIPLLCAFPVYLLAWAVGLAKFDATLWSEVLPYGLTASSPTSAAAVLLTFGLLDKLTRALGEEIGWRGVLVPQLARIMSAQKAGLVSGCVWAAWHIPAIVLGAYHAAGVPIALQVTFFVVSAVSSGIIWAWLRLASNSVWPCVLAHGFWNLAVQSFLDQASVDRGSANWWIGEFGVGISILTVALACVLWPRLIAMQHRFNELS